MATDTVWWTGFCGNRSVYDAFWSPALSVNTPRPDLSLCMQRSVLLWIPAGWMFLTAPYQFYQFLKRPKTHGLFEYSPFNYFKTAVSALMVAVCIGSFMVTWFQLSNQNPVMPVEIAYGIIRIVMMALVTWQVRLEYTRGLHTSAVLCLFWALFTLAQVPPVYSAFVRRHSPEVWGENELDFALDIAFNTLLIVELFASFFADTSAIAQRKTGKTGEETPLLSSGTDATKAKTGNPCPELTVSFWMRYTYQWIVPAVIRNYKKAVTFDELYDIRPQDSCDVNVPTFYKFFNVRGGAGDVSAFRRTFYWALFRTVGYPIACCSAVKVLSTCIVLLNPQILRMLLAYMASSDPYTWKVVLLAFLMGFFALCSSLIRHFVFYVCTNAGYDVRNLLNAVVCRKALLLSSNSKRAKTVGEMVNLLSVDGQKVQDCFIWVQAVLDIPVTAVLTCILMWHSIGWTAVGGIVVIIVAVTFNGFYFGQKVAQIQEKQMIHKDSRLRIINEILNGIKILKLYGWEPSFMIQTTSSRDQELKHLNLITVLLAISNCMWFILPYGISLMTFGLYVMVMPGHMLEAGSAFVTLTYINSLQLPLSLLPLGVSYTGQGLVSLGRISDFLQLEELPAGSVEKDDSMTDAVQVADASFSWEGKDGRAVLNKINLRVKPGELVAVVGHVGAGKSSLLSAILGELAKVNGQIKVKGNFAYVPQQAWIQNDTLKNNIIFGKPLSNRKYQKVIHACALTRDLEVLPAGDSTEIGEKGSNLSGGQKQRVSLARAVYQQEDIYLLDDPLSAVDAHVGKHIFEKVIGKKGLLKHKTRILVTHSITFLPHVDKIVVLNAGHVTEIGKYEELLQNDGAFADYLRTYLVEETHQGDSSDPDYVELRHQLSVLSGTESEGTLLAHHSLRQRRLQPEMRAARCTPHVDSLSTKTDQDSRLMCEELSKEGRMNPRVIWAYIQAGGLSFFIAVIVSLIMFALSQVLTTMWLSKWTSDTGINGSVTTEQASYRLGVYGGLGVFQVVSAMLMMGMTASGCTAASRTLHANMLLRVMRAPMAFFDTTPIGRVMNRFCKDMDFVDSSIPIFLMMWLSAVTTMICATLLISYTTPIFLVLVAVLAGPYIFIMRVSIVYASQLRRLESVSKSPIYAHFEETVTGASSIRAYRRRDHFVTKADRLIDESHLPCFLLSVELRMLGMIVETIAAIIMFFATLAAGLQRDSLDPGMAGMSVTYAIQMTIVFNVFVRASMELETYMISVERVDEYQLIAPEAPWDQSEDRSPELVDWPNKGAVTFKQYSTRYRPGLDLVLSKINLNIAPGEKVGVVGRTGAGKSSLTLAFFRIIESSQGQIIIDGEDISKMGLHKLRSRLTVIPQDPVMFSGSLRMNLDPNGTYSDLDLWKALEHAHLKVFVETLEEGLDYNCGEGGEALSIGQRQLVCLARALLRRSRVLILDEATAAVDLETDMLIQASIRKYFVHCTVITVAHRLNTVLDYDKILVLEGGIVKEFDSPANLLSTKTSLFHCLVKEAGLL